MDLGPWHTVRREKRDQLLLGKREPEGAQCNSKLMVIEMTVPVEVEESELVTWAFC